MENKTCSSKAMQQKRFLLALVARKMHRDGVRRMKCLAFIGGGIQDMIDSVKETNMLVIDGCKLDCGKLTMEKNGILDFCHLRITDLDSIGIMLKRLFGEPMP